MRRFDSFLNMGGAITDRDRANVVERVRSYLMCHFSQLLGWYGPEREKIVVYLIEIIDDQGTPADGILVPFVEPPSPSQ